MGREITPFRLDVPEDDLRDLRERLVRTRWPEPETVQDWSQGVPLEYLRGLCSYWADGYDWRTTESRLNAVPQFRTEIDGLQIHFLHLRSTEPDAIPLVLTHGWPGSVIEFGKVLGQLAEPAAHGAGARSFDLVVPSLPGYGFSDKPVGVGWKVERIGAAWLELMDRLGYERFGAVGSDWGTSISTSMAQQCPDRLIGIHLMPPLAAPDPDTLEDLTEAEAAALESLRVVQQTGDGYSVQQSTRPQTIGYGLVDSPAALAAWLVEKFWTWADHDDDLNQVLSRDDLLDNLMLYWVPGTGASAARLYWESIKGVQEKFSAETTDVVTVPTGCSIFPRENPRPSRRWAAKRFTDIRHWNELDRGGHFAAFEQPDLFVAEVRTFFLSLRS